MPTSPAWSAVTSPREVVDVISSDSSVLLKIRNFRENPTSNVDDSADASKSSMPVLAMPVFAISKPHDTKCRECAVYGTEHLLILGK